MSKMEIGHYIVGPIMTNCYFVINRETKEVVVIDPGYSGKKLADIIKKDELRPVAILLTHGHFDHVEGIEEFQKAFTEHVPVYAYIDEKKTLADPTYNVSRDISGRGKIYSADVWLKDKEKVTLAGFEFEVLWTPGHTPGGCCYYIADEKALFSGDTLFEGSVGRTDFPGGSMSQLIRSIKDRCMTLPDDTEVFPGHEGTSTIGAERKYNYFIQ